MPKAIGANGRLGSAIGAIACLGLLAGVGGRVGRADSDRRSCAVEIDRWASGLLVQLPGYANRQLNRTGSETRMLMAGLPEVESIDAEEEANRVFFSTLETSTEESSAADSPSVSQPRSVSGVRLQLFYRLTVARSRPQTPWQLVSLEMATPRLSPTDVTDGAIWQAIAAWQNAGCPGSTGADNLP